jgi:hypothetical protein
MGSDSGNKRSGSCFNMTGIVYLVIFMAVFIGCKSLNPLPNFGVGGTSPEEVRMTKLIKWHSGRVEVYRDFRTVFTARAVYLSDEIRRIAVDWEARTKLMNPEERRVFEKRYLSDEENLIRILVGFYTPSEEQNDLDMDNTLWIPVLKNKDGSLRRASCFGVGDEEAKIYMRFLRWDLSWSRLYLLCFPYDPESSDPISDIVTMVISGPEGQGEIELRTAPPEDE